MVTAIVVVVLLPKAVLTDPDHEEADANDQGSPSEASNTSIDDRLEVGNTVLYWETDCVVSLERPEEK